MALVLGAIVANRWFHTHRGLVTGIFSAANATGQLLFLPLIARTARPTGWRAAAGIVAVLALLMAGLVVAFLRDRPSDHGLLPYGLEPGSVVVEAERTGASPARVAVDVLRKASRRWSFWALVLTFWVCGWSTNGIIQTHFVPAAHDHGMPSTTAAGLLAVVGIFDIVGTVASGWLTDRVDPRWLLVAYYGGRGLSLLALDAVLAPGIAARHVGVHRLLRPGLGRHRAAHGRPVPHPLRARRLRGGVRLGLRVAHGGGGRGGQRRRVGAHQPGRLPLGLGRGRRAVLRLGGDHPVDPEGPRGDRRCAGTGQPDPGDDARSPGRAGRPWRRCRAAWRARPAPGAPRRTCARGPRAIAGCARSRPQRLGEPGVVLEVAGEQLAQPGVGRVGGGEHVEDGQGALALAQVGARRLAGLVGLGLDVDEVVGELEGDAEPLTELAHRLDGGVVAAGEHRAVARGGGDEHAGLVGEHAEVVVDRVGAGRAGPVVADLARAQPHEGLRLDLHGLRAEVGDDVGRRAEEQVADEDRGGVAVGGVGAGGAAAHVGLVHDVVVVERGEVGQLDPGRGRDDALVDAVAELGREQGQQRPEPLAAGRGEVRAGLRR